MPLFTVIIPTYRRLSSLILCLNCLQPYFDEHKQDELGYEIEAIVTDDAGDLNVRQHIADHFPWCRYVKGPGRGPAANRNHGADVAHGRWLVFVDDDCFPQETFIEAYAQYVSVYKVLEGRTSPFGKRMRADDECPINEQGGCLWSCNFAIRRDLFLELGQFNEAFPTAAMEDVEFYERIKKAHLPVKFVEDAIVLHPWRRRKGLNYVIAHSQSVALFAAIHPEHAKSFSLSLQFCKLLLLARHSILSAISSRIYSGLLRTIVLNSCSCVVTWWIVFKNSSCRHKT
jgi:GT2 family glycosyltransferase